MWCGTELHRAVPGDFGLGWGRGWNDQWDSPAGAAWRAGGRRLLGIVSTAKPILAFFCGEGAWFLEGAAEMSGARAGSWDGWWPTDVYTLLQKPAKPIPPAAAMTFVMVGAFRYLLNCNCR